MATTFADNVLLTSSAKLGAGQSTPNAQVDILAAAQSAGLLIYATDPASTTGNGADAPSILEVGGATGQATTGTTGQLAGEGGGVSIIGGDGGNAPSGSTNGGGGHLYIAGGIPGSGGGAAGSPGHVLLQPQNGGKVGIGTLTPSVATLQVMGGPIATYNSSTTAGIYIKPAAGAAQRIYSDFLGGSEQPLQLGTYTSQTAIHIATDGKVGIGSTSPASRLDIADGALTFQEMTAPSAPAS
jgi:hypothetical protein